jgi:Histidine kinase-, DNA gyrase B-, and HSP90-like ATPase
VPLSGDEPVYVDREMWEKIVLNLVSNAFKFTLKGEIEVRLEPVDGQARLTLRDTGVGIWGALILECRIVVVHMYQNVMIVGRHLRLSAITGLFEHSRKSSFRRIFGTPEDGEPDSDVLQPPLPRADRSFRTPSDGGAGSVSGSKGMPCRLGPHPGRAARGIARLSVESSGSRVTHFTTPFSV